MSGTEQLRRMAKELDELVSRREFSAAAVSASRLAEWARDAARGQSAAERSALLAESARAIETARRKICVARARMTDCLLRLERSAEYCEPSTAGLYTWSCFG